MVLPDAPWLWGIAGGLMGGATDLVFAYSAPTSNPLARRRAWLRLGLGVVAGPMVAEAFTAQLAVMQSVMGARGVAMTLGLMAANDPRGLFRWIRGLGTALLSEANRLIQAGQGDRNDRP